MRVTTRSVNAGLVAALLLASVGVVVVRTGDDDPSDGSRAPVPAITEPRSPAAAERDTDVLGVGRRAPDPAPRPPGDRPPPVPIEGPAGPPPGVAIDRPGPLDYIARAATLSQPDYPGTVTTVHDVRAPDGVSLYIEVTRPDPAKHGDGPWPAILESSPYHGTIYARNGIRILPEPKDEDGTMLGLTGYFPPRGYAVVMMDLRGTGRSGGCLDHLGPDDAMDIKTVVEWAADQPWSSGRVALTGHSYPGSTPMLAAAQNPRGLVTIVPSAGLASMYDHQFQTGVPYSLQWVGPMFAYEQGALQRHLPGGDDFGNNLTSTGCGLPQSSIFAGHGQINGQYQAWHAARDHRVGAAAADIPIFLIHGVNDNAARIPAAEWFFADRTPHPQDKVWIGQWDHGVGIFHPNGRRGQWQYALHAWFDKHLKGLDVETGPAVEAFLHTGTVYTADSWIGAPAQTLTLHATPDMRLARSAPDEEGGIGFRPPPFGTSQGIVLRSAPFEEPATVLGLPRVRLSASVTTSQITHLVVTISSIGSRGPVHLATCAIQPQLRNGVDSTTPVIPLEEMALEPQCFTAAHRVSAGDQIQVAIGTTGPHHVGFPTVEPEITIHTGPDKTSLTLPIATGGALSKDVPLAK